MLTTGLLAVVISHVMLSQQHYELEQLERQAVQSQRRYDQLRLEVARLEAPDRIVDVATRRLGMVMPAEVTYLTPTERVVDPQEARNRAVADGDVPGADEQAVALNAPSGWATVKPHLSVAP